MERKVCTLRLVALRHRQSVEHVHARALVVAVDRFGPSSRSGRLLVSATLSIHPNPHRGAADSHCELVSGDALLATRGYMGHTPGECVDVLSGVGIPRLGCCIWGVHHHFVRHQRHQWSSVVRLWTHFCGEF